MDAMFSAPGRTVPVSQNDTVTDDTSRSIAHCMAVSPLPLRQERRGLSSRHSVMLVSRTS